MKRPGLLGLCVLLIAVQSCGPAVLSPTATSRPTATTAPSPPPPIATPTLQPISSSETTILVTELGPYETYTDASADFAFDYPAGWRLVSLPDIPGSTVTVSSWDPAQGSSAGLQKLQFTPLLDLTYDEALTMVRRQNTGRSTQEIPLELRPGVVAVMFVSPVPEDAPEDRTLVAVVSGTPILVSGVGQPFTYFEAIAYTLRPAP